MTELVQPRSKNMLINILLSPYNPCGFTFLQEASSISMTLHRTLYADPCPKRLCKSMAPSKLLAQTGFNITEQDNYGTSSQASADFFTRTFSQGMEAKETDFSAKSCV